MLSLWGDNLKAFIRQGMKTTELFKSGKLVLCPVGGSAEVFINLGLMDMPQGIVFGAPYWFDAYNNRANIKFVSDYRKLSRSAKAPPSYAASIPYSAVKIYKKAVEKVGTTDKTSVAKTLAGLVVDNLPVGNVILREGDHQAIFTVVFGQSAGIDKGSKILRNMSNFRYFKGEEITPSLAECGCNLAYPKSSASLGN
jgi:ABC-type branched-subunit amino acid transport system substrate-binding protein